MDPSHRVTPRLPRTNRVEGLAQAFNPWACRMAVTDPLVWVDCEMTGLDLGADALIEVACIVTDSELNEVDAGCTVVIAPPRKPSNK